MDIKENFANNLIKFRKALKLTQIEFAEKINYSDKAVSKWERAESIPDIYTLKMLADFFGISVDTLISEPKDNKVKLGKRNLPKKRFIIGLCTTGLVWLVAIICFSLWKIISPASDNNWIVFIYATVITSIVLLVLTSVWGKTLWNTIIISCLVWSSIVAIFLSFISFSILPINLWTIFLIGIPLQCLVIFWYLYKKVK